MTAVVTFYALTQRAMQLRRVFAMALLGGLDEVQIGLCFRDRADADYAVAPTEMNLRRAKLRWLDP